MSLYLQHNFNSNHILFSKINHSFGCFHIILHKTENHVVRPKAEIIQCLKTTWCGLRQTFCDTSGPVVSHIENLRMRVVSTVNGHASPSIWLKSVQQFSRNEQTKSAMTSLLTTGPLVLKLLTPIFVRTVLG